MTTTVNLRKILDPKVWEWRTPAPTATAAARFVSSGRLHKQTQYYLESATVAWAYLPEEDAWMELPSPALGGTFAAGACGTCTPMGPSGTASAGTTTTITTTLTLARNLAGFKLRITGGAGVDGVDHTITTNTVGANAVITFTPALAVAAGATTTYQLITGRWWVFNAHTVAPVASQFKYYDYALNTWTAPANLPAVGAAWGTDGRMVAHPSFSDNVAEIFASGTATAGGASTLTNGAKTWTVNQWANAYQIRITGGTGVGQVRVIASNTGTVITTASAWTTAPDNTSTYVIEGNDDYIYLLGNNAVTMYRYSVSAGTWTTLAPGVARAAAPGLGLSAHWVWGNTDATWTNESAILNGRRIYSFRGGAGAVLDYYDVPSNAWTNALSYAPAATTITTGTKHSIIDGRYLVFQKDATNRLYRFDTFAQQVEPLGQFLYTQGAAVLGDTMFDVSYTDGATKIKYLHMILNTSQAHLRCLLI